MSGPPIPKDSATIAPARLTRPSRRRGAVSLAAALALLLVGRRPARRPQDKDPLRRQGQRRRDHQSDLAVAEEEAGQNFRRCRRTPSATTWSQFVADMILVSQGRRGQEAGRQRPTFKQRLAFARNKLLMEALLQSTGKAALTDEAMHKVYDEAVKQMGDEQEVHARHILVGTEDEKASKEAEDKIKAIIARLKKGEDFAKLAKEMTEDPSGKAERRRSRLFHQGPDGAGFAEVAFKLDKGQISEPVKTQFGWHVIKVEDKRSKPAPTFDEVKPQIETFVTRKAQAELVDQAARRAPRSSRSYKPSEPPAPSRAATPATGRRSKRDRIRHSEFVMAGARAGAFRSAQARSLNGRRLIASDAPMSTAVSPLAPTARAGHAGDRRRAPRDRRGRHPLRRAAPTCCWRCSTRARPSPASSPGRNARRRRSTGAARSSKAGKARALVVNSGNANAFTGKSGRAGGQAHRRASPPRPRGCKPTEVFLASTGVIGEPLDAAKFDAGDGRPGASARSRGDWLDAAQGDHDHRHLPEGRDRHGAHRQRRRSPSTASPRAPA